MAERNLRRDAPSTTIQWRGSEQVQSSFADNAMTRLWRNAEERETGAEAVAAIRARRQQELEARAEKQKGRWRFGRGR